MLVDFYLKVREHGVPASVRELLDLVGCLDARVVHGSVDEFYALSRTCLVKDEAHYDRFDLAFAGFFKGVESLGEVVGEVPAEWLRKQLERFLTPEEMAKVQGLGSFEAMMEMLAKRLAEQRDRHQGGSKMRGTAGRSPLVACA